MEKRLKKGDKVRMRRTVCFDYITFEKGCAGEVTSGETNRGFCCVKMTNAENGKMTEHFICANNLELIDNKTAFLSDLADVLRKHNAAMDIAFWDKCVGIMITIPNEKLLLPISTEIAPASQPWLLGEYSHTPITADNIMDYDKE